MEIKHQDFSEAYKQAGVDTLAGQSLVKLILPFARKTYNNHVVSDIGGFSAIYDLSFLKNYKQPVLLTSTDGVGTKLSYASFFGRYETIGYDLVAMCANDILVSGGKSHIFLDYLAVGKLNVQEMSFVIRSIASACKMIECSLLGGETAEHPNVIKDHDFDLAGFMIGFCEREHLVTGENIDVGDAIIGIPSSGIHSNGLSLVRKLFYDPATNTPSKESLSQEILDFLKKSILLQPTILYEKILYDLIKNKLIKGMVHITGGGYQENIPRILKENYYVELQSWALKSPFNEIQNKANLDFLEMTNVFNCGFGMLIFVDSKNVHSMIKQISENLKNYQQNYINIQKEFFPEYTEWESNWNLPYLSTEPKILGVVKKDSKYNKKVVFI